MTDLSNLFRLDGKRALVTGAGRGIGLLAARALAAYGAHVTLAARSETDIAAAADANIKDGGRAEALVLDVTDTSAVRAVIAEAPAFDILVNNAGTNRPGPFVDVEPEAFDLVNALNVKAAFFVAQAVTRRLIAAGRPGSIINMSSQMGHVGAKDRTIYCTTKFAIEGMTKSMAVELAPHGIRVNSIGPTFIETPMTAPYFENEYFKASVLSKIKLGRVGQVEDLAGALILLASDASGLMTGSSLLVDGGWTAE
ncbi:SDR family NAD(P)-dependent oxidoreductase [uncultured Hoeflea sp.]|uniref:SDR family NAD(P)-dependent oxidoreductase n=1 Tax=uncultured Hoeflea sp. TaxID=538666 RepID=UPI0030ECBA9F|tara:strand:- start:60530 stop:61291 length:762 start_codon:yes stop_codon:yes gene_type:complete